MFNKHMSGLFTDAFYSYIESLGFEHMYDQCEDWTEQCTAWAEKIGRPDIIYAMNLAFEVDNKVCDYQVKKGIETS